MSNKESTNHGRILSVILVLIFLVVLGISYNSLNKRIDNLDFSIQEMQYEVGSFQRQLANKDTEINFIQMELADLWLGKLDNISWQMIKSWEAKNKEFLMCEKQLKDMFIARTHFTREGAPARYLVYSFTTGDLVYDSNGSIFCFTSPIDKSFPPQEDCNKLCIPEENE